MDREEAHFEYANHDEEETPPDDIIEVCKNCELTYNRLIQSPDCPHWADVSFK